jgi:uncharacterized membrane protein
MISSSLGAAHVTAAMAALALGFVVLVAHKGTDIHRLFGVGFVLAMIVLNATALAIFRLTGQFNPFHALALMSLATTVWGVLIVLRRRENWVVSHLRMMFFSYLGLLAAATAEGVLRFGLLRPVISSPLGPSGIIGAGLLIAVAFAAAGALIVPRLQKSALAELADR